MNSGVRILIITSGPLCRNPRPLKEAATLANAGYQVTVLNAFETAAATSLDADLVKGNSIELVTCGNSRAVVSSFGRRVRLWTARKAVRFLGVQAAVTLGPIDALGRAARAQSAALTIVHNEAPFFVGATLLNEGRRVAADFEDWYSEDLLPDARKYRPLRLLRRLERRLLHEAVYTSTTSSALGRALADRYAAPIPTVLTNSFSKHTAVAHPNVRGTPAMCWFSQTIGPGRGLEEFLRAWALTRVPSSLALLGACDPTFRVQLLSLVRPEQRERLSFLDPVPPREIGAVLANYDVGLALELSHPPSRNLTITNKILQYLVTGLAVVASDTAGQREVLSQYSTAGELVALNEPAATAARLDALLAAPARIAAMKTAARAAAEAEYCWERQAPILLERVDAALRS